MENINELNNDNLVGTYRDNLNEMLINEMTPIFKCHVDNLSREIEGVSKGLGIDADNRSVAKLIVKEAITAAISNISFGIK